MTSHSRPYYELQAERAAPSNYPQKSQRDTYTVGPVTSTFEERREQFITHVMRNPTGPNARVKWYELIRMVSGGQAHEGKIFESLNLINDRIDCSDFVAHSILRLLYQFDPARQGCIRNVKVLQLDHPPSQELLDAAKETLLNFKYWPDEPGIDSMCTWTENHYILFSSAAYLAGQLYPDHVFINAVETGREKMERNRPRILRWLDMRFKTGFNEWLSHVYYEEDLTALLSLNDF
jgi:hypothetical protein